MQTSNNIKDKIKNLLLNFDLLESNTKTKINEIYQDKEIKINDKYLDIFLKEFKTSEIEELYENIHQNNEGKTLVYFSMEYGFSDLLPNYSGGLGILAGDHLKQASEDNMNIIAVGLFYKYGYFSQKIINNHQEDRYNNINIQKIIPEKLQKKGKDRILKIKTDKYEIFAQIWKVNIGNSTLLLLDTDIEQNNKYIRNLTNKLYGGDREKRFLQEILLGIGGMRLIYKLKIDPHSIHINEGHSAFALLENTRRLITEGIELKAAFDETKTKAIFTTHTPIIHGNEEFEPELVKTHMTKYLKELNFTPEEFISEFSTNDVNKLMMTVLAIKLSKVTNGVSKLHSKTAQKMWESISENEIKPITNGIHINTWMNTTLSLALKNVSGDNYSDKINNIPDDEILSLRKQMKSSMFHYINKRYHLNIPEENQIVIGFARRFAPYKRADLLFEEMHRIKRIFKENNVLMFLAGKAHPQDIEGNEIITKILNKIDEFELQDQIIFLNNYDIELAKRLTSGCDVWLNTPLKPMEASGTSGMKSALNGGINLSILDGWWAEAYNGKNGFIINEIDSPMNIKNMVESSYLLNTLEYKVIPMFKEFTQNNKELVNMIRNSMHTIHSYFSAERMLNEYRELYK